MDKNNNLERLLTILKLEADLIEQNYPAAPLRYKSIQKLILETGMPFLKKVEPTPFKRQPKHCYENCSTALLEYPELSYCEGYAIHDLLPMGVAHAWLVNEDLEVVDPTWHEENLTGCTYFGVVLNLGFVVDFLEKTKQYGILENDYLNEHRLKREGFPEGALHRNFHVEF